MQYISSTKGGFLNLIITEPDSGRWNTKDGGRIDRNCSKLFLSWFWWETGRRKMMPNDKNRNLIIKSDFHQIWIKFKMRIIFYLIYLNRITNVFCLKNQKELPSELFNLDIFGQLLLIGQPIKITFTGKCLDWLFA